MSSHFTRHLTLIIFAYLVLGISYALATPPLESSDEYKHYPVVQYLQTEGTLPILDVENPGRWLQEGAQPPLYYSIMALATAWIDTSDFETMYEKNPHAFVGDPNQIKNKNLLIHDPVREKFPWTGANLAIYLIRFLSLGLGIGTIWLTGQLGRELYHPTVGLVAAALTAFNPMFLFISTAVNNDSLAALLGSAGIFLLIRLQKSPVTPRLSPWTLALGAVLGAGILTKLSLGGLIALTGGLFLLRAWREKAWQWALLNGAVLGTIIFAIAGWWFWRNWQLYGDPIALNVFVAVQGTRSEAIRWTDWVGEFGTFYRTFWGLFGAVNVSTPQLFYYVSNLLLVASGWWLVTGKLIPTTNGWPKLAEANHHVVRVKAGTATFWLLSWVALLLLLLIRWNITFPSFQGRLLFPALGSINLLWATAICHPLRKTTAQQYKTYFPMLVVGWFLVMAALLPFISIRPAYDYPKPLGEMPASPQFGPILFPTPDGEIQLVGVEMTQGQTVQLGGGQPIEVTLYWQATHPVSQNYVTAVHLLGRGQQSVGQVDRYPAWGMIPTSQWQAGQIWRDPYHIYVRENALAPTQLQLNVALYHSPSGQTITPYAPDGTPISLLIVGERARLISQSRSTTLRNQPANDLNLPFADGILLRGYTLKQTEQLLQVILFWEATKPPTQEYTVFVQLLDEQEKLIGSGDAPPVGNDYPTTLWQKGDWIEDPHSVEIGQLPTGDYTIALGLYEPTTGLRLSRSDGQGDTVHLPFVLTDK